MKRFAFVALVLVAAGCTDDVDPDGGFDDAGVSDGGRDSSGVDGGGVDGGGVDGGGVDGGIDPCASPAGPGPARILFVGNSFTFTASMPTVFRSLAVAGGYAPGEVVTRAIGGQTLQGHRGDSAAEGAPARVREGWDVVILQEYSTRPTDSVGPADRFKIDATWFYDLAVEANPEVRVILYETFARRFNHAIYPGTFDDPEDMQAQLRFHYRDCAENYIPAMSEAAFAPPVEFAAVGDAWESVLMEGEPPRLHGSDDYHPSAAGAYLTALVFFGTIYDRSTVGLPAIGVDEATALELQETADRFTRATRLAPALECVPELPVGDEVRVDFGPTAVAGWAVLGSINGRVGPLVSVGGAATGVTVSTSGFTGTQTGGSSVNDLGYPGGVSSDSLWVGSFDGHAAALALEGTVTLSGLSAGTYEITVFASRDGSDGGNGRVTRYAIGSESLELDVADNEGRVAVFAEVESDGAVRMTVGVATTGASRFGYVGSLVVRRVR